MCFMEINRERGTVLLMHVLALSGPRELCSLGCVSGTVAEVE